MADLLSLRLLPFTPPFHVSSSDCLGPFKIKIVGVLPGSDGRIRNVKVKTPKGVYSRPLCNRATVNAFGRYKDCGDLPC